MQPFGILVCMFCCPVFNPPFHEGALAPLVPSPITGTPRPLQALGSSERATFPKAILAWLQVAIERAVMSQGYH